jgi:hypothetical protein
MAWPDHVRPHLSSRLSRQTTGVAPRRRGNTPEKRRCRRTSGTHVMLTCSTSFMAEHLGAMSQIYKVASHQSILTATGATGKQQWYQVVPHSRLGSCSRVGVVLIQTTRTMERSRRAREVATGRRQAGYDVGEMYEHSRRRHRHQPQTPVPQSPVPVTCSGPVTGLKR